MKILFVHQNFPAQFKHLAPALVREGHEVVAIAAGKEFGKTDFNGVPVLRYIPQRVSSQTAHPWLTDLETKVIRADAVYALSEGLRKKGFVPDLIVAHPGWGEALFLKTVWRSAKLLIYCEFFYKTEGADVGFDEEFNPGTPRDASRIALKNINNILSLQIADAGMSPTAYQASTFPEYFRKKITVVHDGIDTKRLAPNPQAKMCLSNGRYKLFLDKGDDVITFVNRSLEPYRGYHVFMRALPAIMRDNPKARVLIVGGSGVSYGVKHTSGKSWKEVLLQEVGGQIDHERLHFLGSLSYSDYLSVLQISKVHVYLTYPFVLSWSLLEAMSVGCAVVASATPPVEEVIADGVNGRLVNFFDQNDLAKAVTQLLGGSQERIRLGDAARRHVIENYDLETVCLPKQLSLITRFAGARLVQ